jgi:predicted lactoylglutathione lyase
LDSRKALVDVTKSAATIVQVRVASRQRLDELVERAFAAGGVPHHEPNDQGFLYGRSFQELDGHLWDVLSGGR